jgi:hypothetical protein
LLHNLGGKISAPGLKELPVTYHRKSPSFKLLGKVHSSDSEDR